MAIYHDSIKNLNGVGSKRAELFEHLGIYRAAQLVRFYPRAYKDWSKPVSIAEAENGEVACVRATVRTPVTENRIRKGMTIFKTTCADDSGAIMQVTIFNNKYLAAKLRTESEYLFYGKVIGNTLRKEMASPEVENIKCATIHPIYRATEGLSSRVIETVMQSALRVADLTDPIPKEILNRLGLLDLQTALWGIHFPKDSETLQKARKRLIFEELFLLQTGLKMLKGRERGKTTVRLKSDCTTEFERLLPFTMTGAQKRVTAECIDDMQSSRPMNRLLQGDVGSGKTAVAAAAAFSAAKNGYQSAMMVPTEILAEQHFRSISALLKDSDIKVALLTGGVAKKEKDMIKAALISGEIDFIIGTHALIQDTVSFKNLGLVITDEQHRFGVAQRAALHSKGDNPHLLIMSATPIPRTLALIIHGDLDISIIDELPPGRQPIETYAVKTDLRERAYNYVKKHLDEGKQGYIVCPVIDEGEGELLAATEFAKELESGAFRDYKVGLIHGRMKYSEKEAVMRGFASGEIQLLVATTVIEVGVDVPNAVIMVIENAERFGLSQLHQLRGRIGRGKDKSTCILISDASGDIAKQRLKVISSTSDGFKIADEDLKLRGPGDFFGYAQHGLPALRIADFSQDMETLREAGIEAEALLKTDPDLTTHLPLKKLVENLFNDESGQTMN